VRRGLIFVFAVLLSGCGVWWSGMLGPVSRASIETELGSWRREIERSRMLVDEDVARSLRTVPPGAEVDVFLGTWCRDSRRLVSRLFVALEVAGEPLPFSIRYVGVDRQRHAPRGLTDGVDLRYVPTIIVHRDGAEVGRIVESAPRGVETELRALLTGERTGTISLREDL
jgi:hypothetical protein